jgi:hypothetical protein
MKAEEFIIEHKKGRKAVRHNPKPRSPVAHAAQSVIGGSASGAHKDKKKAEKQGDVKHKQQSVPMESTLSELSTELLGKYKKAAHADAKKADAEGDYARGDKRFKGINKATNKQFDNDLKKHGQKDMAEAMSQRNRDQGAIGHGLPWKNYDDLDQLAQDISDKILTITNIVKLNSMAHDSTIYNAIERYFKKYGYPDNVFNRVASIVFKKLDDEGRRMTTDPRIQEQGVAEGGYDQGRADPRAPSLGAQDRREFKRAELQHELGHERNNIAVSINGKLWKVFAGKGTADSFEERQYLNHMRTWAEKKSAASGKKWSVGLTGAEPTT